jgi:peptide/nickel transport system substrate-binding protein
MLRRRRRVGALAALLAIAVVAAGCGGGTKKGGSITIGTVGPDSYDPVEYQTLQAESALHLVYTPLLTFRDTTGPSSQDLVPGMADSVPSPTNGGKTYTFHLHPNLKYSDGTPVKASDFTHVVKRLLVLAGPFSPFFTDGGVYPGIVGADKVKKPSDPLPGVKTDDATGTITINLTSPNTEFLYAVALPSVGLTPPSKSAFKNLTANPPPGDGPYTMKIVNPSPTSGEFVLTKNPKFDVPGLAKGNIDKITGMVSSNVNQMAENIANNKWDYMTEDPTGDLLPQIESKYGDRFRLDANPPNTYYFFLNVKIPPFNNLAARQAVNYAIDSRALERIFGGRLKPSCNFLPPAMTGYQQISPCPYGDPNGAGNIAKAKQLVSSAGLTGKPVTVWTNSKPPRPDIGDYLRSTLNQIGFKASIKTLDQKVYFATVGNPKTNAQIGFTDWFQDFPHPGDFFGSLLTGAALASTPTFNEGLVDDPQINSTVVKLLPSDPKAVSSQWAALDKLVVGPTKSYVVPYGNEEASTFMSDRMDFKSCSGGPHFVYRNDWALFCLKK